jgi:hypothetical protein
VPTRPINALATRVAISSSPECLSFDALDVDLGAWPVIPRVAARRAPVTVRADAVSVGRLRLRDLKISMSRVNVPISALWKPSEASLRGVQIRARLAPGDLSQLVRSLGLRGDVRLSEEQLRVVVPGVTSSAASFEVVARDGGVIVTPTGPIRSVVPPVRLKAPFGLFVDEVQLTDRGLIVSGSAPSDLGLNERLCDSLPGVPKGRG